MNEARPGFVQRHAAVLLILWTGCSVLLGNGATGYIRGDALLYAAVMKQIAQTGDWLPLRIGDEPYFNKPPLMFWWGAALFKALGTSVWVARLIGALPSMGLMFATFAVVRRLADPKRALLASLMLGTFLIFGRYGGIPRLEAPLTLFAVAAVLAALASRTRPNVALLFGASVAGGFLVKGPAGLLPVATVAVWSLLRRDLSPWNSWRTWVGLVVLVPAVRALWFQHLESEGGYETYMTDLTDTAGGLLGTDLPWERYGKDILVEWLPWLPFVAHGLWICVRRVLRGEREGVPALAIAWFVVNVVSILCIQSAYARYLFPLLPAIAMFAAESVAALFPRFVEQRLERTVAIGLACATTIVHVGPFKTQSSEVPELVTLAPALRAHGATEPIPFLSDHVGRRMQSSAIVHLGTIVRTVSPDDVRAAVRDRGACVVVIDEANNTPRGLVFTVLVEAGEYQAVEFRTDPTFESGAPPQRNRK